MGIGMKMRYETCKNRKVLRLIASCSVDFNYKYLYSDMNSVIQSGSIKGSRKKSHFFSGPANKREGGGVRARPLQIFFLSYAIYIYFSPKIVEKIFFCQSPFSAILRQKRLKQIMCYMSIYVQLRQPVEQRIEKNYTSCWLHPYCKMYVVSRNCVYFFSLKNVMFYYTRIVIRDLFSLLLYLQRRTPSLRASSYSLPSGHSPNTSWPAKGVKQKSDDRKSV